MATTDLEPDARAASASWIIGKHLLITGASSGIGREVARQLVGSCARLTLIARNRHDALRSLSEELNQVARARVAQSNTTTPTRVDSFAMDVRDTDAASALVESICSDGGQIDAFLNCAGGTHVCAGLEFMTVRDIDEVFDVNAKAPIQWLRELLPRMRRNATCTQKAAHIVLLSSRSGERGLANMSVYAAAKGSMERLVEAARAEYAGARIGFTLVCPGAIDTAFTRDWPDERRHTYRAVSMPLHVAVTPIIAALNADYVVNRISYESVEQWLGEPGVLPREGHTNRMTDRS